MRTADVVMKGWVELVQANNSAIKPLFVMPPAARVMRLCMYFRTPPARATAPKALQLEPVAGAPRPLCR